MLEIIIDNTAKVLKLRCSYLSEIPSDIMPISSPSQPRFFFLFKCHLLLPVFSLVCQILTIAKNFYSFSDQISTFFFFPTAILVLPILWPKNLWLLPSVVTVLSIQFSLSNKITYWFSHK